MGNNLSGFDEIFTMFDNALNQSKSFEGKLTINIENLISNIDSFNSDFDTNFTVKTPIEDFQEYFQEEYTSLFQEHLTDGIDYKSHFNSIYENYAHIE